MEVSRKRNLQAVGENVLEKQYISETTQVMKQSSIGLWLENARAH